MTEKCIEDIYEECRSLYIKDFGDLLQIVISSTEFILINNDTKEPLLQGIYYHLDVLEKVYLTIPQEVLQQEHLFYLGHICNYLQEIKDDIEFIANNFEKLKHDNETSQRYDSMISNSKHIMKYWNNWRAQINAWGNEVYIVRQKEGKTEEDYKEIWHYTLFSHELVR